MYFNVVRKNIFIILIGIIILGYLGVLFYRYINYSFFKTITISNSASMKAHLDIDGQNVSWLEFVKFVDENGHDSLTQEVFISNLEKKSSVISQVSQVKDIKIEIRDPLVYKGISYWVQNNNLYTFNKKTQEPVFLLDEVRSIKGVHGQLVVFSKQTTQGQDDQYLYVFNLQSKVTEQLPIKAQYGAVVNKNFICTYSKERVGVSSGVVAYLNQLQRYDLDTKKIFSTVISEDSSLAEDPTVTDCQDDFIVYRQGRRVGKKFRPPDLEYVVYQISTNKEIFKKVFDAGFILDAKAKKFEDNLYITGVVPNITGAISNRHPLVVINLTTNQETELVSDVTDWDIDGSSIAYAVQKNIGENLFNEIYINEIYLIDISK